MWVALEWICVTAQLGSTVLGSTEEVARGVVMSESSSGSAPRVVSFSLGKQPPGPLIGQLTDEHHRITNNTTLLIQPADARVIEDKYLTLPQYLISDSGLDSTINKNGRVLYKRDAFTAQIQFILTTVIRDGVKGVVYGQPGTGKSCAAFYVGCYLRKDWDVIWVHTGPHHHGRQDPEIQNSPCRF